MSRIERSWYREPSWITALLLPAEGLFALVSAARRALFRRGWLRSQRLDVPVVVIGNINVGGVGKTPLTLQLLQAFAQRGVRVGVISRGYGGSHQVPTLVGPDTPASLVGDEPRLIAAAGAPVMVGRDRVAAGRALLALHPELDLILSDDGLQHYRLARQLEIVVVDGARGLGNGHLLPAGPLREPPSRLGSVDALVVNGAARAAIPAPAGVPRFAMQLAPGAFYRLDDPSQTRSAADFAGERVVAAAGIGHPQRFFDTLATLGLHPERCLAFPDHHDFSAADLPQDADAVVVTAKDAVKLQCINHARLWVLPVAARVEPGLADWILDELNRRYGRKVS